MKRIVEASPDDHFIVWHDLEERAARDRGALPGVALVYGTQDLDQREQTIIDFSDGKFRLLAAKPVIAGSGCQFQRHCHRRCFSASASSSTTSFRRYIAYSGFYRRSRWKYISSLPRASANFRTLNRKWRQHEHLVERMGEIIADTG